MRYQDEGGSTQGHRRAFSPVLHVRIQSIIKARELKRRSQTTAVICSAEFAICSLRMVHRYSLDLGLGWRGAFSFCLLVLLVVSDSDSAYATSTTTFHLCPQYSVCFS